MEINISHVLLKNSIENNKKFIVGDKIVSYDLPRGVYASSDFKDGDIIRKLEGTLCLKPTKESIHIGNNLHVIDKFGKYMNHSFEPNTKIELNNVIAIRDIKKNEELTFNYNDSEVNIASPFFVDGKEVCGKKI